MRKGPGKRFFKKEKTSVANDAARLLRLDDLFAEQITLKFSTYLARVAIP